MTDKLVAPETDHFSDQAKIHHQIRDKLREAVSSFDTHHDTITGQLESSQTEHYSDWWRLLKNYMLDQADLHEQLGNNLITAGNNYYTSDQNVANKMQETPIPPLS
ncbi:hypothetical protein [Tengunoibacter tsumagoiensis]|uniref:Uncharacterized protein n=1 Tax=Tengunoibacter tsumagoiensis TaxID=2014871 RepID=A0A402A061_9CHLR|nr:hypothetical protein [Tengunoibacter tsumagoiensis]GCE12530.1 hypothetical protein KTT_23890 [Tengunoibacter tsumagoiensis]